MTKSQFGRPGNSRIRPLQAIIFALMALVFFNKVAIAGTLQTLVVSTTQPSATTCTAPPVTTSFATTDTVYVFFQIQNLNAGDQAALRWINPSGSWVSTNTWNGLSNAGNWCFTGASRSASELATTGTWRLEVYINGALLGATSFAIGSPSGSNGSTPSYSGSFDGGDCTHVWGWWKDNNNPDAKLSVDIYVDGKVWATIVAGDSRPDLTAAGIGAHAWNGYSLPQNLHDGNQHIIRVTNSGTSTDLPGSPKTFQNACGASTPTTLSASFVPGNPPSTMVSGHAYSVNWQVSGANQIQSRLCYGTSSDPATQCQQQASAWQSSGPASLTASIGAPTVTGTAPQTIYFVIQAQVGGQTVYSAVAQTLDTGTSIGPPGTPPSNVPTWTYDNDPNLAGLAVVVQKQFINGNTYQYRFNIVERSLSTIGGVPINISAAHLTVVSPHDSNVKVHRTSLNGQLIYEYGPTADQILQSVDSASWQNESRSLDNFSVLAKDALGFIPFANIDTAVGIASAVQDVLQMLNNTTVGPSSSLNTELGSDDYDVYGADVAGSLLQLRAVRFSVNIDVLGNEQPHFFLMVKQQGAQTVGFEVRDYLDVPIIRNN